MLKTAAYKGIEEITFISSLFCGLLIIML